MAHAPSTRDRRSLAEQVADHIGWTVRVRRMKAGWTETELAAHCRALGSDLTRDSIHRIEMPVGDRQRRRVRPEELIVLSRVFGVGVADLLPPPQTWPGAPPGQKPHRKKREEQQ